MLRLILSSLACVALVSLAKGKQAAASRKQMFVTFYTSIGDLQSDFQARIEQFAIESALTEGCSISRNLLRMEFNLESNFCPEAFTNEVNSAE